MNIMKKKTIPYSPLAKKCLTYGLFAIICNLTSILFLAISDGAPPYILAHRFAPMIEYPIMTVAILVVGALLFDYIEKENEDKK